MNDTLPDLEKTQNLELVVITICRNNPSQLVETCQSVAYQNLMPSRHLVVDGSDSPHREEMEAIAASFGSDYMWVPPLGIYDAMEKSLNVVDDSQYVWFLNATDRFASNTSTIAWQAEASRLSQSSPGIWFIGQTLIAEPLPHRIRWPDTGDQFADELRRGTIGLPHASTIVRARELRQLQIFGGPYRISRDYEMALVLSEKYGPPILVSDALSVYDESGESARNAWLNVLHKSEARIKNQPWWHFPAEPFRILAAGRRELLRTRLRKNPKNDRLWQALGWERIDPDIAKPFWERDTA